ncbi:MAG TPA: MdtA/MuxA family multidrug efflux RND transporter periplasmic adaptor subunit [Gammaproteobacteria bacterium]|nr:MdtA/MuxA family multidrug efflux RND transporter periplasmic adaptor subunit [Gammaproteobacteria bacterium]
MTSNSGPNTPPLRVTATQSGYWLRSHPILMITILGLVVAGSVIWYAGSQPAEPPTTTRHQEKSKTKNHAGTLPEATPVVVAPVRQGELNIYQYGLGIVTPLNVVEVRSRVSGQLLSIAFEEGQMVKAGDLLAQIDPVPFKVQLRLATAQQVSDQALLDNANIDLDRYKTLLAQDSVSRKQFDTQQSLVHQYQAAVQTDQEVVKNAKLQLSYARIIAPISGRVGFRQVGPGNIVRESDPKGIVVITQLDPISVIFSIPEDALPRVMKLLNTGDHIPVDIYDRALKKKIGQGRLLAADNQIDTATGTIKLKAELPNSDRTFFANQFVNVKMAVETLPEAILLPTTAIQRGATGTFVYVVKDDQTVTVTPVKTGPSEDETTAIESGISAGTTVVVDGVDRLREGAKVKIVTRDTPSSNMGERELNNDNKGSKPQARAQNSRVSGNS